MASVVSSRVETLGDRLRKARKLRRFSARGLSCLAGLSPGHVTLIERRRGGVDAETAWKLAVTLGVSPEWLITGQGEKPVRLPLKRRVREAPESAEAAEPMKPTGLDLRSGSAPRCGSAQADYIERQRHITGAVRQP